MEERPTKRARNDSPPNSTTTTFNTSSIPFSSMSIYEPNHYTRQGTVPTSFQQPLHLTSFSYSPTREVLLEKSNRNDSISYYNRPDIGVDLNRGFEDCIWRQDDLDEGLDSLLDSLSQYASEKPNGDEVLAKTHVITWRGMISKLLLAVYEVEGAIRNNRSEGWEMNAMVLDGVLYLEESKTPTFITTKRAKEDSFKSSSYIGYSFESYCTLPRSLVNTGSSPSSDSIIPSVPPETNQFSIPNTNVQWCSVVKTNLGGFRILTGGEVDCLSSSPNDSSEDIITTNQFIELKTNIAISSQRDEINFERIKLLKHYVQSFLLGVPQIIVGFRTRSGILTALESFKTLEIPRLVRGKPHAWDPLACLASGKAILAFLHGEISQHTSTKEYESKFASSTSNSDMDLKNWPIFRIVFSPKPKAQSQNNRDGNNNGPGISIRELSSDEIASEVIGGKKVEDRVGFLLLRWTEGVQKRRNEKSVII